MSRNVWQYQAKVEPLEPTLYVEQKLDWLRPTSQPIFDREPQTHYYTTFHVDPTIYVEQNLDWLQQTNQPIFAAPFPTFVFVPGQFEPSDYAGLIDLDWLVETQQPLHDLPRNDALYGVHLADGGLWAGPLRWTALGGVFYYDAANWMGNDKYFQVYVKASSGTVYARLYSKTTGLPVGLSEVSTSSTTLTRLRSVALVLADGNEYEARVGVTSGGSGTANDGRVIGIETD